MKFTTKLFLFWISVFLIFYLAVMFILLTNFDLGASLGQLMLIFSVTGILPPAVITAFFSKKLDYMESENVNPPTFKGQKKATFQFSCKNGNSKICVFDEVWQIVDRNWIISFSDRKNQVLKFRTDSRMMSWGIGGYVKVDNNNTVEVIVYPIFDNSRREELVLNQTLRLMQSVLSTK